MNKIKFKSEITDNQGSPFIANPADGEYAVALGDNTTSNGPAGFATGFKSLTYPCSRDIIDEVSITNITETSMTVDYSGDKDDNGRPQGSIADIKFIPRVVNEEKYLLPDFPGSISNDDKYRYADRTKKIIYKYNLTHTDEINYLTWKARCKGQMLLEVSPDNVKWYTVFNYKDTNTWNSASDYDDIMNLYAANGINENDQGKVLTEKARSFKIDPTNIKDLTFGPDLYVRIGDAYSNNGFGGAVRVGMDSDEGEVKLSICYKKNAIIAYRVYYTNTDSYDYYNSIVEKFPHTFTWEHKPIDNMSKSSKTAITFAGLVSNGEEMKNTDTAASYTAASASGFACFAVGKGAHAGGYLSTAWEPATFAHGYKAKATGDSAAAFGAATLAKGDRSFAAGVELVAAGGAQAVFGRYNEENKSDVLIVGWGSKDKAKNIFTVSNNGTGTFTGDVKASGKVAANNISANNTITIGSTTITEEQLKKLLTLLDYTEYTGGTV